MTSTPSIRKMIFVSPLKQSTSPGSFTTSPLPADDASISLDTSTSTLDLTAPVTYSNPAELDFVNRVPASRNRIIKRKPAIATTLSSPSMSRLTKTKSSPARNIPGKRKLLPKSIDLADDTTTTSAQVLSSSSQNDTAPTTAADGPATTRPTGKTLTSSSSTTSRSKQLSADDTASLPTSIESSSAPVADPPPYDLSAPAPAVPPANPPLSLILSSRPETSSSSVWARKLLFQATEAREKYEAAAVRLASTESSWQTIMQTSMTANQAAVDALRRSIAEVAGQASELKRINQDLAVCLTDMRRVIALNNERIDSADQGIKLLSREIHDLKAHLLQQNSPSSASSTSHAALQQQDIPVKQESRPANHSTFTQTHIIAISSDAASDEFDLLLPPITSDNRRSLNLDD